MLQFEQPYGNMTLGICHQKWLHFLLSSLDIQPQLSRVTWNVKYLAALFVLTTELKRLTETIYAIGIPRYLKEVAKWTIFEIILF